MVKVWKDNGCILHLPMGQAHLNSCQHSVSTQVDTDLGNSIFPHFACAILGFYMPAVTDDRTQMCRFSGYKEHKDW